MHLYLTCSTVVEKYHSKNCLTSIIQNSAFSFRTTSNAMTSIQYELKQIFTYTEKRH